MPLNNRRRDVALPPSPRRARPKYCRMNYVCPKRVNLRLLVVAASDRRGALSVC